MPVLIDQRHVGIVVEGDNGHRTVVLDHLAPGAAPAGHPHLVGAQCENLSDVDGFAGQGVEIVFAHGRQIFPSGDSCSSCPTPSEWAPLECCSGISTGNCSAAW